MTTGFLSKLITKNCHLLTTRTVDDAPGLKAFKVPNLNLLITRRTVDDEVAPGLLTFKVPGKPAAKKAAGPAVGKKADVPSQNKNVREDVDRAEIRISHSTRLKSVALREPAITSLKEQVRALQELDIPGWSGKNVQVQQQVIEVVSHIASTATKFPKISIAGICERVPALKTRAQAMKCLTTFSEAMGTGFIFERLSKIMKEHKNPKVLSEGLLWMVSVDDFGVAHLKLKDVFHFCNDIGLQSSAAATTIIATIKLIGVLHKLVGSDIKAFLSDVMPALLSVIEAECEKNPF
ncbi:protein MOR1, partial [Tanacetum coccineum]